MMRFVAIIGLVLVACTPETDPPSVDLNSVELELRRLLAEQASDWNEGNLEGFVSVYADDAVFVSPSGLQRGRQNIFERYVKRYRTGARKMGQLDLDPFDFRISATGDRASVALRWNLVWESQDPAKGLSLITLGRGAQGGWQILQDASM